MKKSKLGLAFMIICLFIMIYSYNDNKCIPSRYAGMELCGNIALTLIGIFTLAIVIVIFRYFHKR